MSVIIPTHNRPRMLRDALLSVYSQTYPDWEAIVVDDGGAEVSAALEGRPLGGQDVQVMSLSTPQGPAAARNAAIRAAHGEILAFLDDDDLYRPHHLERLGAALTAVKALYRRHDTHGQQLVSLARELYFESLASPQGS